MGSWPNVRKIVIAVSFKSTKLALRGFSVQVSPIQIKGFVYLYIADL